MTPICIIPARGGSKRLPRKNLLLLDGKPLIAHSIEYARREMPEINIYVTTDDAEIAAVSERYGAKIILRPAELASDTASSASALEHAAAEIMARGDVFDVMVLLQVTSPLRPSGLLQHALDYMCMHTQHDSLMTVSPMERKLGKIQEDHFIPWNYFYGQRSQDMEPLYFENGLLYISKRSLIEEGRIMGDQMYPMVVDHVYGTIDIDTEEDLKLAEYYISRANV